MATTMKAAVVREFGKPLVIEQADILQAVPLRLRGYRISCH